jgi:hypothetical protein
VPSAVAQVQPSTTAHLASQAPSADAAAPFIAAKQPPAAAATLASAPVVESEGTTLQDPLVEVDEEAAATPEELTSILRSFYEQDISNNSLGDFYGKQFDVERYYDLDDPLFGDNPFLPQEQPVTLSDHGAYDGQDYDVSNLISQYLRSTPGPS